MLKNETLAIDLVIELMQILLPFHRLLKRIKFIIII